MSALLILFVSHTPAIGGAENSLLLLLRHLDRARWGAAPGWHWRRAPRSSSSARYCIPPSGNATTPILNYISRRLDTHSASGLPVVAGRSGGAVEAVKHGETGYLVDPHDPDGLAEVLLTLLQNRELRAKLGQAGRHWVETEMNWDRAARQMEEALQLN